jgi:hypothetical protein
LYMYISGHRGVGIWYCRSGSVFEIAAAANEGKLSQFIQSLFFWGKVLSLCR